MLGSSNAMTETYLMEMDARQAAKLKLDFNALEEQLIIETHAKRYVGMDKIRGSCSVMMAI